VLHTCIIFATSVGDMSDEDRDKEREREKIEFGSTERRLAQVLSASIAEKQRAEGVAPD
jgi:hypothetical protein